MREVDCMLMEADALIEDTRKLIREQEDLMRQVMELNEWVKNNPLIQALEAHRNAI